MCPTFVWGIKFKLIYSVKMCVDTKLHAFTDQICTCSIVMVVCLYICIYAILVTRYCYGS